MLNFLFFSFRLFKFDLFNMYQSSTPSRLLDDVIHFPWVNTHSY
jgi:hypothetical protein